MFWSTIPGLAIFIPLTPPTIMILPFQGVPLTIVNSCFVPFAFLTLGSSSQVISGNKSPFWDSGNKTHLLSYGRGAFSCPTSRMKRVEPPRREHIT